MSSKLRYMIFPNYTDKEDNPVTLITRGTFGVKLGEVDCNGFFPSGEEITEDEQKQIDSYVIDWKKRNG